MATVKKKTMNLGVDGVDNFDRYLARGVSKFYPLYFEHCGHFSLSKLSFFSSICGQIYFLTS